jgi:hypothetical protein
LLIDWTLDVEVKMALYKCGLRITEERDLHERDIKTSCTETRSSLIALLPQLADRCYKAVMPCTKVVMDETQACWVLERRALDSCTLRWRRYG